MLRKIAATALAASTLALMHGQARANAIIEDFSIPSTSGFISANSTLPTTPFAEFDPALGTLNSISVSLSGPVTWTLVPGSEFSVLLVSLAYAGTSREIAIHGFSSGSIGPYSDTIDLSGTDTTATSFAAVIGTATTNFDLRVDPINALEFESSGFTGSVTFNYTPPSSPPPATVPEPSSLAVFAAAMIGLGVAMKRRFRYG